MTRRILANFEFVKSSLVYCFRVKEQHQIEAKPFCYVGEKYYWWPVKIELLRELIVKAILTCDGASCAPLTKH